MKKPYISPTSEKIQMETGNLLMSASDPEKDSQVQLDGYTETDEQW